MQEDKFEYSYTAPTEEERKEIESIRRSYSPAPKKKSKLDKFRELDRRVKLPAVIAAIVMCVAGTLIFGTGLTMILEWDMFVWGSLAAVFGGAVFALAFPLRKYLLARGKKKYGKQITELADELLNNTRPE